MIAKVGGNMLQDFEFLTFLTSSLKPNVLIIKTTLNKVTLKTEVNASVSYFHIQLQYAFRFGSHC
jgi:hypothetical protein